MKTTMTFLLILVIGIQSGTLAQKQKPLVATNQGDTLKGSLYLPKRKKPKATIVFVHGSAPTTRKDRYYNYLKPYFLEKGFAVALYDKRGSGESGGTNQDPVDFHLLAGDAVSIVESVKKIDEVKSSKIGLAGTSQGGWIAPMAAVKSSEISFVITISGPTTSSLIQTIFQREERLNHYGIPANQIPEASDYLTSLYKYLETGEGHEKMIELKKVAENTDWFQYLESHEQNIYPPSVVNNHPGLKRFKPEYQYDPESTLAKIQTPYLAVFGEKDRIIPVGKSIERIRKISAEANNEVYFEIKSYPNSGHLMQIVDTPKELLLSLKETTEQERIDYMTQFKPNEAFIANTIQWIETIIK